MGQCEDLGLEGGEEPLEDSAERKDINRCRILQTPSGSSMEKDHSGTGQKTAARTEMVRRGRTLDACIWKMESTGFC